MSEKDSFERLRQDLMRLYESGDYTGAFNLVDTNVPDFPEHSARTTFWKMCLLSLDGRLDDALFTFRQGLDDGLWWAESQFIDTDLDPLRALPEFKKLVAELIERWEQERVFTKRDRTLLMPDEFHTKAYPLLITLHGRNGNKNANLEHWEAVNRMGWAILSPQSTQPLFPNSYCWDDSEQGIRDILFHLEETLKAYPINRQRILVGGFSQGSGMAIHMALSGKIPVQGFIACATWWPDVESLAALAVNAKAIRGYFVTGKKDNTLERAREIQSMFREHGIPFAEEVHPDLGHEFPTDFESSLIRALEFIFKE